MPDQLGEIKNVKDYGAVGNGLIQFATVVPKAPNLLKRGRRSRM